MHHDLKDVRLWQVSACDYLLYWIICFIGDHLLKLFLLLLISGPHTVERPWKNCSKCRYPNVGVWGFQFNTWKVLSLSVIWSCGFKVFLFMVVYITRRVNSICFKIQRSSCPPCYGESWSTSPGFSCWPTRSSSPHFQTNTSSPIGIISKSPSNILSIYCISYSLISFLAFYTLG